VAEGGTPYLIKNLGIKIKNGGEEREVINDFNPANALQLPNQDKPK
jgi:hypothetical protein